MTETRETYTAGTAITSPPEMCVGRDVEELTTLVHKLRNDNDALRARLRSAEKDVEWWRVWALYFRQKYLALLRAPDTHCPGCGAAYPGDATMHTCGNCGAAMESE